jgi:hypothetical protein
LAEQRRVPLLIAAYIHFIAWGSLNPDEVRDLLCVRDGGLFYRFPEVSGFLHFAETGRRVMFYEQNPEALRPLDIPRGLL